MKGWGYGILVAVALIFGCIVFPLLVYIIPKEVGIVMGITMAAGVAFRKVMRQLYESNHFGDSTRQYADYTDEPMKFER